MIFFVPHLAGSLQDGRGRVSIKLGLRKDGRGDSEALAPVRHVERRYRRVVRHLLRDVERLKGANNEKFRSSDMKTSYHVLQLQSWLQLAY